MSVPSSYEVDALPHVANPSLADLMRRPHPKPKRSGRPSRNGANVLTILGQSTLSAADIVKSMRQHNKGMSAAAAARALQRAVEAKQVASTAPISFGSGRVYLYWNPNNHDRERRLRTVMEHLSGRPALRSIVNALIAFKGQMPKQFALRCTSAPVSQIPRHVSFDRAIEELRQLDIIRIAPDRLYGFLLVLEPHLRKDLITQEPSRFNWPTRLRAEGLALELVAQWLQVTSLVAWKSVKVRNSNDGAPEIFNHFAFDLVAPCYVTPVARTIEGGKRVPGFLLADICIGRCDPWMAENLLRKLVEVRSRKNPPVILGSCFAGSFSQKAMQILRGAGVLAVPLERIGSGNLAAIVRAMATTHALALIAPGRVNIERTLKGLTQLANNRDGNLAGRLFEFIMARSATLDNLMVVHIGKIIQASGRDGKMQKAEVDVIAHDNTGKKWTAISAKGYNAFQPVRRAEVEEWFGNRIALVQQYLADRHKDASQFTFVFATSSYFDDDALDYMKRINPKYTKKVRIEWWDAKKLQEKWETDGRDLIDNLQRFYGRPADIFYSVDRGVITEREAKAPELGLGLPPRPMQTDMKYQPSEADLAAVRESVSAEDALRDIDDVVRDLVPMPEVGGEGGESPHS